MTRLRLFSGLLLALAPGDLAAQLVTVRGAVRDSADAPIAYAVIEIVGTARRFSADSAGRYVIEELADGTWTLRASALGYRDVEANVAVGETQRGEITRDFRLESAALEIPGIVVAGEAARPVAEAPVGAPPAIIDRARINAVPAAFEPA